MAGFDDKYALNVGSDNASEQPSDGGQGSSSLHVDSDWKAQARAEKERLAEQVEKKQEEAEAGRQLPPADFQTLMSSIVTQALLYMGAIPDPMTGQRIAHVELAKHHIDLLAVLKEKTAGNLSEEEESMINQTLEELNTNYVQLQKMAAAQMAQQQAAQLSQGGGMGPGPMGGGPMGPIQ